MKDMSKYQRICCRLFDTLNFNMKQKWVKLIKLKSLNFLRYRKVICFISFTHQKQCVHASRNNSFGIIELSCYEIDHNYENVRLNISRIEIKERKNPTSDEKDSNEIVITKKFFSDLQLGYCSYFFCVHLFLSS